MVTQRPTLANFPEYVLWDYTDTYEERWVGLGTKKGVRFCTGESKARPHYVCVVETDNQTREPHLQQPRCMGCGRDYIRGRGEPCHPGLTNAISLRLLHQNLGHPRKEDLVRHRRLAGCEEAVLKAAKGMQCDVCASTAGPKISRPSTAPRMYDFNDCVGADLLHHHDSEDQRHTFLSIVDWGTSYPRCCPSRWPRQRGQRPLGHWNFSVVSCSFPGSQAPPAPRFHTRSVFPVSVSCTSLSSIHSRPPLLCPKCSS